MRTPRTPREWGLALLALLLLLALASGLTAPLFQQLGETVGMLPTSTGTPTHTPTASVTPLPSPTFPLPSPTTPLPSPSATRAISPTAGTEQEPPPGTISEEELATALAALEPRTATPPPPPTETLPPPPPTETPAPVLPSPLPTATLPPAPVQPTTTAVPQAPPTAPTLAPPTRTPAPPTPTIPPPAAAPPPSFNACQSDPNEYQAPNYPVRILWVNKETEVFALQNVSDAPVDLRGWIMCSVSESQRYDAMNVTLAPGETRRFVFPGAAIWKNEERDDGALYNPQGQLISYWFNF
jgi:hypothetical protein